MPGQLQLVEIENVSRPKCSVVVVPGRPEQMPVVLVHGILDNVWQWLTPRRNGPAPPIPLAERPPLRPLFDNDRPLRSSFGTVPRLYQGRGLLERLSDQGLPAVAYSYQDRRTAVAPMGDAVERLHRVAAWAVERWKSPRLILLGHSRGGLVCRHAMLHDSSVMSAREFRGLAHQLITVCTPHLGSQLARVSSPLNRAFAQLERWKGPLSERLAAIDLPGSRVLGHFRAFVTNMSQLTPDSEEVQEAASRRLPRLEGGYFAIAGNVATYFLCEIARLGRVRLPPAIDIPEFTDGEGDMAVRLPSALDIPDGVSERTRVARVNHLTANLDPRVQGILLSWIRLGAGSQ